MVPTMTFSLDRVPFLRGLPLLTLRGAVAGVGVAYLALGAVSQHSDIIASVLVALVVALLLALSMLVLVARVMVRRGLDLRLVGGGDPAVSPALAAGEAFPILMRLGSFTIPFFTVCNLRLQFRRGNVNLSSHRLSGRISPELVLREDVRFPHRGLWEVQCAELTVSDIFGFFRSRWRVDCQREFPILPAHEPSDRFPIVSSSERPGDEVPHARNRQGDPYELKPYHPSDGMRKIVWKIFAKRGELVSRHPEASMSPEGQTLVYTFARRTEDRACGLAIDYVRRLDDLNLDIFFSVEGASAVPGSGAARSVSRAEDLLLRAVWEEGQPERDLEQLLQAAASAQGREVEIRVVVLVCAAARFQNEADINAVIAAADRLVSKGIAPIFFITGERTTRPAASTSMLSWWFFGDTREVRAAPMYPEFLKRAAGRGWEVYR